MKKRTITLERDAKVFGGDVVAASTGSQVWNVPLQNLGQTLHCRCDQSVRLFDRTAGLVDEGGLNPLPAVPQVF